MSTYSTVQYKGELDHGRDSEQQSEREAGNPYTSSMQSLAPCQHILAPMRFS